MEECMVSPLEFLKGEAAVKGAFLPNDARAAVAALLVEAALLDGVFSPAERACILRILKDHFNLSPEEARSDITITPTVNEKSFPLKRITHRYFAAL